MRHVPYAGTTTTAAGKNGKDLTTTSTSTTFKTSKKAMAISATSAEDSWFGSRQRRCETTSCRLGVDGMVYNGAGGGRTGVGGGGGSGGSDDSGIVNIIDDSEMVGDDDGHGGGHRHLGLVCDVGRAGSNENDLVRRGSSGALRGISGVVVGDSTTTTNSKVIVSRPATLEYDEKDEAIFDQYQEEDEEYDYDYDYERSSDEESYSRRLLLTALSAAAVVPSSRRGDLAFEKWPLYHKKSYLFKRRRRPSLSNVVEIYENCVDGDDKCSTATLLTTKTTTVTSTTASPSITNAVVENGSSKVSASSGRGCGAGAILVSASATLGSIAAPSAAVFRERAGSGSVTSSSAVRCVGGVGSVGSGASASVLIGGNRSVGGADGRKSSLQSDYFINHTAAVTLDAVKSSSSALPPSTKPSARLFGSVNDLHERNVLIKDLPNCSAAVPSVSSANANGALPSSAAVQKARRSSLSKSWYGEDSFTAAALTTTTLCSEKLPLNGSSTAAADKDGSYAAWRRRRTFTSVPEDEDVTTTATAASIGEIGVVDGEERVVLLERRSVSVPNDYDDALSTTPTAAICSSAATTAKCTASYCYETSTTTSPVTAAAANGASKLGKWSRSKIDLLLPSLKSLVTMTTNKLSASRSSNLNCRRNSSCVTSTTNHNNYSTSRFDVRTIGSPLAATLRRNISLSSVQTSSNSRKNASSDNLVDVCLLNKKLRKCNTVLTLSGCISKNPNAVAAATTTAAHQTDSGTLLHVEPLRPVNRLRVSPNSQDLYPLSRMCSRCSSLLSMASSSRYSLNSAHDFVPIVSPSVLCKVCLNEVPLKDSWTLQHCECSYCVDCVRSYVEFEINQGAYSISCPDAQCEKQGIIMLEEIESLVSLENIEKHKRYRLNKEVEMDKSRTWCPRAGCETVCTLCSTDRCTPQSVHCPTCNMDFCSNCRTSWHAGSPCKSEEVVPGVTFDSELIKCCPMCSVPIEKDEGCAQMLCKRCKHVFCWYCLASLDDDFLLRHYDKGPCKNKLGHSRASVIWHRTQVISIFAGFGILLLIASPLLLLAAPCIVCCKCRVCTSDPKLDADDDIADATELQGNADSYIEKEPNSPLDSDSS